MLDVARQCPCCGGPAPGIAASWLLDDGALVVCGRSVRFTTIETKIFDALWKAKGRVVSKQALINACWGDSVDGGPETAINCISVTIARMRKKLDGTSLAIGTSWAHGFSLKHGGES